MTESIASETNILLRTGLTLMRLGKTKNAACLFRAGSSKMADFVTFKTDYIIFKIPIIILNLIFITLLKLLLFFFLQRLI